MDGQSVKQFAARAEIYLQELEQALKSGEYRPEPIKRVEIAKGDGRMRPLGIPAVKDRIVQTAVKLAIEPIFEREFEESSYGFRPGRSAKDALGEVDGLIQEGFTHVVDADLESFFDTLEHPTVMRRIEERISDGRVLKLIDLFLSQDIIQGMKRWTPVGGTPQGGVISPLLANIYLHPLDRQMKQQGYRMVRYADDFVVLCRSAEQAQAALSEVRAWTEQRLNADKTHVGDCRQAGQGLSFWATASKSGGVGVRKRSLLALRERIRHKTRRTRGDSLGCIIADLNPILRGWFHYFKHTQPWAAEKAKSTKDLVVISTDRLCKNSDCVRQIMGQYLSEASKTSQRLQFLVNWVLSLSIMEDFLSERRLGR